MLIFISTPSAPPKRRPDLLSTAKEAGGCLHVVDEVVIGNTTIDDPRSMKVCKLLKVFLLLFEDSQINNLQLLNAYI